MDPTKVRAIREMPQPDNVAAVQRLLGVAQYLSKFLPHLSDITKPLRELTQKDTAWVWEEPQQEALETPKKAVTSTPVLRYNNLIEEFRLQCDASSCLGAAMMQNGQPVAYASRALTTEPDTLRLKKSSLPLCLHAIDLKPISMGDTLYRWKQTTSSWRQQPLHSGPKWPQRMLLRLRKYSLKVKYKKGEQLFLADTLSRAFFPEVHACDFCQTLEEVDHTLPLALTPDRIVIQQFKNISADDPVLQVL